LQLPIPARHPHFEEDRSSLAALIDTVHHQATQVHAQLVGRPEALEQGDRAVFGLAGLASGRSIRNRGSTRCTTCRTGYSNVGCNAGNSLSGIGSDSDSTH
jgi:hypothetical protein